MKSEENLNAGCSFEVLDEVTRKLLDNESKENLSNSKEDLDIDENETDNIKIRLGDTSAGQNIIGKTEEKSLKTEKNPDNDEQSTDKSKDLIEQTEGKGSATEKEKLVDEGVIVEQTVTVESEGVKSEKLRNENLKEVEQCGKLMVVQNPGVVHGLQPRVKYYKLWQKIIKEGIFPDLKMILKDGEDGDKSCTDMNMVFEWDRKYNFQENIWFLQVLLDICKANHLVSECAEFAKSTDVCYISRDCKENQRDIIYIHTSLEITDKDIAIIMENIRKIIETI